MIKNKPRQLADFKNLENKFFIAFSGDEVKPARSASRLIIGASLSGAVFNLPFKKRGGFYAIQIRVF